MKKYYITLSSTQASNQKQKAYEAEMKKYEGTLINDAPEFVRAVDLYARELQELFPAGNELRLRIHQYEGEEHLTIYADTNTSWYHQTMLNYVSREIASNDADGFQFRVGYY